MYFFLILFKINRIMIVSTIFLMIQNQTEFCLISNSISNSYNIEFGIQYTIVKLPVEIYQYSCIAFMVWMFRFFLPNFSPFRTEKQAYRHFKYITFYSYVGHNKTKTICPKISSGKIYCLLFFSLQPLFNIFVMYLTLISY